MMEDLFNDYLRGLMSTFQDDDGGLFGGGSMLSSTESLPMPKSHFVANVTCKISDTASVTEYKRMLLQSPVASILVGKSTGPVPDMTLQQLFSAQRVYLYSKHRSMLMMRTEQMIKHHVSIENVNIVQGSEACFGRNTLLKNVLQRFIGYHAVVRAWVLDTFHRDGYLYNIMEKDLVHLSNYHVGDSKNINQSPYPILTLNNFLLSVFLYYVVASVISLTLRLTQENMLKFAYLLTHYVRLRLPYFNLVTTHILGSFVFVPVMIGLQYFMAEFYRAHLLSFLIITLIWMEEIFVALCVRTWTSKVLFPKATLFYFWAFNVYCENYGYGFTMVALLATLLFFIHIMFVFYYESEIPALENGSVSALSPRQWIQIEMYENVALEDGKTAAAAGANGGDDATSKGEETIWHTGGVPRRYREPIHNNTRISGGVSTSTIVVGQSSASTKRVLLSPPPGIKLHYDGSNSHSDSSGFVRNLALSRRIQYEQMSSVLGHSVMESSGMATIYYKSAPSAAVAATEAANMSEDRSAGAGDQLLVAWIRDILATAGLDWGMDRRRNSCESLRASLGHGGAAGAEFNAADSAASAHDEKESEEVDAAESSGKKGRRKVPNRPKTGISPYDLTGYVPAAKTGVTNRSASKSSASAKSPERPFPPREPVQGASMNDGPSPVGGRGQGKKSITPNASSSDFGYKNTEFRVFGDLG